MTYGGRTSGPAERPAETDLCAFPRDQVQYAAKRLIWFLQRQRNFIVAMALAVAAMTATMCYLVDPEYTATAGLVVERSRNPVLRNETERPVSAIEVANDLRDIMRSRPVIEAIVDKIRPYEGAHQSRLRELFARTLDRLGIWTAVPLRERYIRRWGKTLMVESDGDYISVSMTNEDPALATAVINAAVGFQQQRYLDLLRAAYGSKLRQDVFLRAQSGVADLRRILFDANAPVTANPLGYATALSQLRMVTQLIASFDAQAAALRVRLGPQHPDTLAAQQMGEDLRAALAALAMDIQALERSATVSEETHALLRVYQENLDEARKGLEKSQLLEKSDTRTVSLRIAEYAQVPVTPDASRLFRLLVGCAAGVVFALGAATVRDRLSTRLNSTARVEEILGSPVRGALKNNRKQARLLLRPRST